MAKRILLPILIIVFSLFVAIIVWSNSGWSIRPVLVFGFILFCPGLAMIRLVQRIDLLTEIVLSVALSLVLSTLIAVILLLVHYWSPSSELVILVIISLSGAVLKIMQELHIKVFKEKAV